MGAIALPAGDAMVAGPAFGSSVGIVRRLIDATSADPGPMRRFAGLPDQPDPHLSWWREWQAARQAADEGRAADAANIDDLNEAQ